MAKAKDNGTVCRVGLMSRIDFGSDGFRLGYMHLAREDFKTNDVHYIVWAGGVVSEREVKRKVAQLKREEKALAKQLRELTKLAKSEEEDVSEEIAAVEESLRLVRERISSFSAESIAETLAAIVPQFVNAKGEPVKVYIVASPVYDGALGEEVAQQLAALRNEDIRTYKPGTDSFFISQADKRLEVLTPTVSPWRGDHDSTGVQRVLKDAGKIPKSNAANVQVAGCFGVTLTKPEGASRTPWIAIPVLHKLQGVRVSEHQIGVRVMDVHRDRIDPIVRTYSYKDYVVQELAYITPPTGLTPAQKSVVKALKDRGELPTSMLAETANLSRKAAEKAAASLVREDKRLLKGWPGLVFYEDSKRWDFNKKWLQQNLRYPAKVGDVVTDSVVAYGCLHAGAVQTDYKHFVTEVPKVILESGATHLVGAGDMIEGLKHGLILRGEVYGGLNCTAQEQLAGSMVAKVTVDVFKARFGKALLDLLTATKGKPTRDQLAQAISDSLITNVVIPGNHDEWIKDVGVDPLMIFGYKVADVVTGHIEDMLIAKDLCFPKLRDIVKSKILVLPNFGRFSLPSGLNVSVQHPHMGNTTTESIRLQSMLRVAAAHKSDPGCQVVIGANFHTGLHMETWEQGLGPRVGLQIGTGKHSTDFEIRKLKIVDHGFAHLRLTSIDKRITSSEVAFHGSDPDNADLLKPTDVFESLMSRLGLA